MATKMTVAFANTFTAKVETEILNQLFAKRFNWPLVWKRFIDDDISLWNTTREEVPQFIQQANKHHQTIKFTKKKLDLKLSRCYAPTLSLLKQSQYTHFSTCRPSDVNRGFIKGEPLALLRTNSSKTLFEESVTNFKTYLLEKGYPEN